MYNIQTLCIWIQFERHLRFLSHKQLELSACCVRCLNCSKKYLLTHQPLMCWMCHRYLQKWRYSGVRYDSESSWSRKQTKMKSACRSFFVSSFDRFRCDSAFILKYKIYSILKNLNESRWIVICFEIWTNSISINDLRTNFQIASVIQKRCTCWGVWP